MLDTIKRDGKDILTTGYPGVERLIDTENFVKVNEVFQLAYAELDAVRRKKRGLKKGRDAAKAIQAIEHVIDLFKELLEIKYSLQEMLEKAGESKKKK